MPRTNGRTNCAAPRSSARTAPYSPGRHGSTREQSQCLPAPFVFAPHPDCHCQPPALDPLPVLALLLTPLSFSCHRSRRRRLSIVLAPWIFIHPYFRTPEPKQIEHAWLYILQQGVVRHDAKKKKLVLSYCNYIHACLGLDLQESRDRSTLIMMPKSDRGNYARFGTSIISHQI